MRYDYDFYRSAGKIVYSQSTADLDVLVHEDVIWIDLFSPSGDEKRTVEKFLDTEIQSRAQAEEIESSSRFSETDTAIFANTNFLIPGPEEYAMEAVSFTLVGNVLTTLRDVLCEALPNCSVRCRRFRVCFRTVIGCLSASWTSESIWMPT